MFASRVRGTGCRGEGNGTGDFFRAAICHDILKFCRDFLGLFEAKAGGGRIRAILRAHAKRL